MNEIFSLFWTSDGDMKKLLVFNESYFNFFNSAFYYIEKNVYKLIATE